MQSVVDPDAFAVVQTLKRRRTGRELLTYKQAGRWVDVRASDVNEYLKDAIGDGFSAEDFRTWNATVMAAVSLAVLGRNASSRTARKRVVTVAIREVARYLGNTLAVCRASYVDPRVVDRFDAGAAVDGALGELGERDATSQEAIERAVLEPIR